MDAVYYTKDNKDKYEILNCTLADIDTHYKIVEHLVKDTDVEYYQGCMEDSVHDKLAFKVVKNGSVVAFLYIRKNLNTYFGASIWGQKEVIGMVLLFKELYETHPEIPKIKFAPHNGDIKQLKALVTRRSIRLYHNGREYLVTDVKELVEKCKRVYLALGMHQ